MKNIFIAIFSALFIPIAFATSEIEQTEMDQRPIFLEEEFSVKPGDTKIIPLPRYTYIDRMSFEVKTSFLCGKDQFRISFDGYAAQNVEVAGGMTGWRNKIVTADVRTKTFEVYNSTNCKIKLRSIEVLPRRWAQGRPGHHHPGSVYVPVSDAAAQVSFLLETLLYVEHLVGDADRMRFITPAKKRIGKAMAVLNSAPETSQTSLAAIRDVLEYLRASRGFIEKLATIEATFEAAQEIQSVESTLERMVR